MSTDIPTEPVVSDTRATTDASKVEAVTADPAASAGAGPESDPVSADASEPTESVTDGILGYKGPSILNKLRYSKRYFWFQDEAIHATMLNLYVDAEKPPSAAFQNAAWSTVTGKGLLYFAKRPDEKAVPIGVICLADITEVSKGPEANEFQFKIGTRTFDFQTKDTAQRDAWHASIESAMYHSKSMKEDIITSSLFKDAKEAIVKGTPGAAPRVNISSAGDAAVADVGAGDIAHDNQETVETAKDAEKTEEGETEPVVAKEETEKTKSKERSSSRKRGSVFGVFGKKDTESEPKEEDAAEKAKADEAAKKEQEKKEKKENEKKLAAAKKEEEKKSKAAKEQLEKEKAAKAKATADKEKAAADAQRSQALADQKAAEKTAAEKKKQELEAAAGVAGVAAVGGAAGIVASKDDEPTTNGDKAVDGDTAKTTKSSKRNSIFGFFNRDKSPAPAAAKAEEVAPAVPAKDDEAVTKSAETTDAPTVAAVPTEATGETSTVPPAAEAPAEASTVPTTNGETTDPAVVPGKANIPEIVEKQEKGAALPTTERRRSSFFGLGKKEKSAATSPTEATEAPVAAAAAEESTASPSATAEEKKPSTLEKLFRRGSKLIKRDPSPLPAEKSAAKAADTVPEAEAKTNGVADTTAAEKAELAAPTSTAAADTPTGASSGAIGDVVPEAVTVGDAANVGAGASGPAPAQQTTTVA